MRFIYTAILLLLVASNSVHAESRDKISDINAVQGVISDQISAFLEGDSSRAFAHAAPIIRQRFKSAERFIQMVKSGYQPLFLPNNFRFTKHNLVDQVLYQELIVTGDNGGKWRAGYALKQQEDGTWKILSVVLQPLPGDAI